MPLEFNVENLRIIESWYKAKCNGNWEHIHGIEIKTCDNPGWILSFSEMSITKTHLASVWGQLLNEHDAQVTTDGTMVRIFSPSLCGCIAAAATIIGISKDD